MKNGTSRCLCISYNFLFSLHALNAHDFRVLLVDISKKSLIGNLVSTILTFLLITIQGPENITFPEIKCLAWVYETESVYELEHIERLYIIKISENITLIIKLFSPIDVRTKRGQN